LTKRTNSKLSIQNFPPEGRTATKTLRNTEENMEIGGSWKA